MKNITIRSVHVLLALLVQAIAMVPLRDASGVRGPMLREWDGQVPEGL